MKGLFLKSLEMGWKAKKAQGLKEVNREELINAAMRMLSGFGDTLITKEDINQVIDKVWGKENDT